MKNKIILKYNRRTIVYKRFNINIWNHYIIFIQSNVIQKYYISIYVCIMFLFNVITGTLKKLSKKSFNGIVTFINVFCYYF